MFIIGEVTLLNNTKKFLKKEKTLFELTTKLEKLITRFFRKTLFVYGNFNTLYFYNVTQKN